MLACYYCSELEMKPQDAIDYVRKMRRNSIHNKTQENFVHAFYESLRSQGKVRLVWQCHSAGVVSMDSALSQPP